MWVDMIITVFRVKSANRLSMEKEMQAIIWSVDNFLPRSV